MDRPINVGTAAHCQPTGSPGTGSGCSIWAGGGAEADSSSTEDSPAKARAPPAEPLPAAHLPFAFTLTPRFLISSSRDRSAILSLGLEISRSDQSPDMRPNYFRSRAAPLFLRPRRVSRLQRTGLRGRARERAAGGPIASWALVSQDSSRQKCLFAYGFRSSSARNICCPPPGGVAFALV